MRNLKLLHSVRVAEAVELTNTQHICVDYDTKLVYCATDTGLYGLDTVKQEIVCEVSLEGAGFVPVNQNLVIVGIEHLPDQMCVCVATATGDVILWNTTNNQLECVGSVPQGLMAMSWSADQELVVLATGQQTLIMMTREFDPITEVPIFSEQFGQAEFVNVGWGKKETQFHGTEGKQAALVKKSESPGAALSWDDQRTRICWHGDGQYFVVSAVEPDTGSRRLRTWTRDCSLHSTSEPVDGLEQALGWKSTGNLITSSQLRPNRHDIVFFEKNGLRHGEFTLPFGVKKVHVKDVLWNKDSSILAVWLEDLPPDGSTNFMPHSHVQLWTVGNYHWYLKQSVRFAASLCDQVVAISWDPEHASCMHIMCRGGQYLQYTWAWATHTSLGPDGQANVAVIDGDCILMTPFSQMIVPPPMAAYQLQMSSPVNQVVQAPPTSPDDLAVLTADNQLAFFMFNKDVKAVSEPSPVKIGAAGGNGFRIKCDLPVLHSVFSLTELVPDRDYPLKFYHLLWYREDMMILCSLNIMGSQSEIISVSLDHNSGKLEMQNTCEIDGCVYNSAVSMETGTVVLELTDGRVLQYNTASHTVQPWLTSRGKQVCYSPHKLCSRIDVATLGDEEVVIGLTDNYKFYVNNMEVSSNCTSYALHEEFLLLTTYAHACRCICRKIKVNELASLSDGKAHPYDESVRRVERGSRIVTVLPSDTKLLLQMPRGNLETVHPRALVLCAVRKHLDRLEYKKAFNLMRKHRINMNLIHDHNPAVFLGNVDTFVRQVETPSLINQFLTDLQEEDVTRTMYTASYNRDVTVAGETNTSKVDTICERVKEALENIDRNKYLLSILTSHVRKTSPELDVALKKVQDLKGSDKEGISAEDALKYLVFLVDVNELYDVALGTYDFNLVLMVAERSQKDPKEYIPFLNSLRKMDKDYQRYTIDKHLKRYGSALHHIVSCGEARFSECLQLVKDQRLYREAMAFYKPSTAEYKEVTSAYGDFLREKNHLEEAGLMYSKAESWESAISCYEQGVSWRLCVCTAYRAGYPVHQVEELCTRLVRALRIESRHGEAACLLQEHLNDVEEAIVTLIEGRLWEEALRIMHKSSRTDFIETHFNAALLESSDQYVILLNSVHEQFIKHKTRLTVVRDQKERERLEFLEGGADHNRADADLFSDTSSATGESAISDSQLSATDSNRSSIFTKRSGRSAKTRRKQERKKWSLKEGSAYEDIALLESLSKSCKQAEDWKGEISSLLRMLTLFHHEVAAAELQEQFDLLLTLMEKSVHEICPEEANDTETVLPSFGPDSTANTIAQAMQRGGRIRPDVKIDPSLKVAPVLSRDNKWKLHCAGKTDR